MTPDDDREDRDDRDGAADHDPSPAPGGPYFGRLLIVLLLAVAFCGFMTWLLSTIMTN